MACYIYKAKTIDFLFNPEVKASLMFVLNSKTFVSSGFGCRRLRSSLPAVRLDHTLSIIIFDVEIVLYLGF